MTDLVGQYAAIGDDIARFGVTQHGVGLEPSDKAAAGIEQRGPPGEIVVAEVEHIGGTGFDGHHVFGDGDIVDARRGEGEEHRLLHARVEHDVQFGGDLPIVQPEPALHARAEAEMRCVDQANGTTQGAAGGATEMPDQLPQQVDEQLRRPIARRICQRRAGWRLATQQTQRPAVGRERRITGRSPWWPPRLPASRARNCWRLVNPRWSSSVPCWADMMLEAVPGGNGAWT